MSKLHYKLDTGIGFVLLSSAALAAYEPEQTMTTITEMVAYALILFVVVVGGLVYFGRLRDKHRTPLNAHSSELNFGSHAFLSLLIGPNQTMSGHHYVRI
jgi:hypothetical protein